MTYGLFQYYKDELSDWTRTLEFHKEESRSIVGKIAAVIDQQVISPIHEKESSNFIDQFMVQVQNFEHIINQITSQQQRLDSPVSFPGSVIENPIGNQQDTLRAKMQTTERNFIRTKYMCSIFLSSYLNDFAIA